MGLGPFAMNAIKIRAWGYLRDIKGGGGVNTTIKFEFPSGAGIGAANGFDSSSGKICGYYEDSGGIRRPIVWTSTGALSGVTFTVPGAGRGEANGFDSSSGKICGYYIDVAGGVVLPIVWTSTGAPVGVTFTVPSPGIGFANGFDSSSGKICGYYYDSTYNERPIVWNSNGTPYLT